MRMNHLKTLATARTLGTIVQSDLALLWAVIALKKTRKLKARSLGL